MKQQKPKLSGGDQPLAHVKPLVGWREWVALPDLGVEHLKCKVDTGARSSSLHAFDLRVVERDGEKWVEFTVHPIQRNARPAIPAAAKLVEYREIRSSTGHVELRPVIETKVQLGAYTWPIQLTLTNRDEMGFRMLLGRLAIKKRFWVDPNRSFLLSPHGK